MFKFILAEKNSLKISSLLLFLIFLLSSLFVNAQHQSRKSFNSNWKFIIDSTNDYSAVNVNDTKWRTLNVPHDWSIEGKFDEKNPATTGGGALPGGIGWYRKAFTIPFSQKDKSFYIGFDGVYRNSEVFINGHSLGVRPNGYISFEYELTPYLKFGIEKNIIAVKVDNTHQPNSRWYSGSGIFRNVWLTALDKVHVNNWGTFITTPKVSIAEASVVIITNIITSDFILKITIYNAQNKIVDSKLKNTKGFIFIDGGTPSVLTI